VAGALPAEIHATHKCNLRTGVSGTQLASPPPAQFQ
jgi:hypothetical protein